MLEVSSRLELLARFKEVALQPPSQAEMNSVISEMAPNLEKAISRERALSEAVRIMSAAQWDLETVMPATLNYAPKLSDPEIGILFEYRQNSRLQASHTLGIPEPFKIWLDDRGEFSVSPTAELERMAARKFATQSVIALENARLLGVAKKARS